MATGQAAGKKPAKASPALKLGLDYDAFAKVIDAAQMRRDIEFFAGFRSRALGYEGSDKAAEYVVERLRGLGYEAKQETFPEVMPIDHGGRLECEKLDAPIPVHACWPNLARTPSTPAEGLSGELIYARTGEYRHYDGRQVKDSIVVLDFNSANNYLKAFMLGARAVIFLEPPSPERKEAETKLIGVPVYAPKYYVEKRYAQQLIDLAEQRAQATVHCRMLWERVFGVNIIARVPGTEKALTSDGVMLAAYFDATSVVPALCPGADQASGIAVWLQFAKLLKQHPPKRPVTLLATNGHFMNNAGVKSFLLRHPRSAGDAKSKFYRSILREGRKWVSEQKSTWRLRTKDVEDWPALCAKIVEDAKSDAGPSRRIWDLIEGEARHAMAESEPVPGRVAGALNDIIANWEFYRPEDFAGIAIPADAQELLERGRGNLSDLESEQVNRRLLEAAYPGLMPIREAAPLWPKAITGYDNPSPLLGWQEVTDWPALCSKLLAAANTDAPSPGKRIWESLKPETQEAIKEAADGARLEDSQKSGIATALNEVLKRTDFYETDAFARIKLPDDLKERIKPDALTAKSAPRTNRLLLEACFPSEIAEDNDTSPFMNYRIAICLDLSSHSSTAGVFVNGIRGLDEVNQQRVVMPINNVLREHADAALRDASNRLFYSGISGSDGIGWGSMLPTDVAFDSRPFLDLRREAVSIASTLDMRLAVDTPQDSADLVDYDGLAEQARTIAKVLGGLLLDKRRVPTQKISMIQHLDFARTRALYLDPKKMTYTGIAETPVPNVLILLQDFDAQRANPGRDAKLECPLGHTGLRAWGHMLTNPDGWASMIFDGPDPSMRKDAYMVEPDGRLAMSIDYGLFGVGRVGGTGGVSASTPTVLFPFMQLEFYETLDVRELSYVGGIRLLDQNDGFPQRWGGLGNGRAAMISLDPMWQLKLIAGGSGEFALLLLNTSADEPTGEGFGPQPDGRIPYSFFQAVKDQECLVRFRRDRMRQCGIRYPFTDDMVDRASASMLEALELRTHLNYSGAMQSLFDATTRAGTAYPLIWNVMTDTIYGLILVFVLVVPFSIFLERLLFGAAILQRRLMGVLGIFVCICLILNALHPGFEVATSPYLIPLAFAILSLVLIVLTMMLAKFDRQVQELHDVAARVHDQDVNRAGATWAGFSLGIGNMRRRKSRTTLTLLTLVLLTYSLLSLTSGEISRRHFRATMDHEPSYPGVMVRDRQWGNLSEAAPEILRTSFAGEATIAPRCWKYDRGEQTLMASVECNGRRAYVYGFTGFTPEEAQVSGINSTIDDGRWFTHGGGPQCMLPENLADQLGLTEADVDKANVRIYGRDFRLIAIYQPGRLQEFRDLDGEQTSPLLPVRTQASTVAGLTQFVHLDMTDVVLCSYEDLRNMGTPITSVAMRFNTPERGEELIRDFASRTNVLCFIALGDEVEAWSFLGFVWVTGLADLLIPLAIGGLIILNTMLTSVYERAREIGIFGSVGLSPIHISTLFFAESVVYGVLGIMFGYLVGQVSAYIMIKFGLVTTLSLNYSSASAVFVSVLVFILILVSTAYPAWAAYRMSTPGVARTWHPPKPQGHEWHFEMPFHVPVGIAPGIAAFLYRYFESYREASVGVFYTDAASLERGERDGLPMVLACAEVWIAPFDAGVKQEVRVSFPRDPDDRRVCDVRVRIDRMAGTPGDWQRMNRRFFKVLRKQFLIWRTIRPRQRQDYVEQGRQVLEQPVVSS